MLTAPASTTAYSTRGVPLIPCVARTAIPETACATVLFADLHGYGAIVERLPPDEVLSLLEEFFAVLNHAVLEWGGQTFRQAEADMMAGFGVGDCHHTQINEAIAAARAIQQNFAPLRTSWQVRYSIDAGVGIGVHRGDVAIAFIGRTQQTLCTLVGDTANVAAHLCKRARVGEVLLSDAVYLPHRSFSAALGRTDAMTFLCLPRLQLRGRSAPLDAWCIPTPVRLPMRHAAVGSS
jgi:adenylate cyclase